jgi:hypothetical protein
MPAVLAGIDVAAKRGRPGVLDRRHDLELGKAQMTGLNGAIAGSFSAEDIGDLERGAQAGSAAGILALHQQRQTLERTGHRADRLGCNARVERGRIELAVPQQDLDDADIDILFQQMGKAGQGSGGVAVGMPDEGAKLWRSVWGDTRFLISAASAASWIARLICRVEIGSVALRPGNSQP